ncbi:hypothetical protein D3C76_1250250 [compost metagenome]
MILAGLVVQFAVGVGEVPGNGTGGVLLQVVDQVLEFFGAGMLPGFPGAGEQRGDF